MAFNHTLTKFEAALRDHYPRVEIRASRYKGCDARASVWFNGSPWPIWCYFKVDDLESLGVSDFLNHFIPEAEEAIQCVLHDPIEDNTLLSICTTFVSIANKECNV